MNMMTRRRMLMIRSSGSGRLPSGYQEVEWLRGSGTQYCESAFHPFNNNDGFLSLKGDITVLSSSAELRISSRSLDQSDLDYKAEIANQYLNLGLSRPNSPAPSISITQFGSYPIDIHYEINNDGVIANNASASVVWNEYDIQNNILIGAIHTINNPVPRNNNVLIKSIFVYNNETLLAEIIPCVRKSDGKAGFYQTNVPTGYDNFIYNLGSGSDWLVGPNV